jgi:LAO/AO transport system kinase
MKSGVMEIADIFVVNKSDRDGADAFANHLKKLAHNKIGKDGYEIPVINTVATDGKGIQALSDAISQHLETQNNLQNLSSLFAERAFRLIQRQKMKSIPLNQLKEEIAQELATGHFNLYRFSKKYYSN